MSLPTPQYPGVDPDANRGPTINAVGIIFLCFTAVVLALRFFSRVWTNIAIAIDDWLIVVAAVGSRMQRPVQLYSMLISTSSGLFVDLYNTMSTGCSTRPLRATCRQSLFARC